MILKKKVWLLLIFVLNLSSLAFAGMKEGHDFYSKEQYVEAANEFYGVSKSSTSGDSSLWFLAMSLKKLAMPYSAAYMFNQIIQKQSDSELVKKSFFEIYDVNMEYDLGQDFMMQILEKNESRLNDSSKLSNLYSYYKGIQSFDRKNYDEATTFFEKIGEKSDLYAKSLFYRGISENSRGEPGKGLKFFLKISSLENIPNRDWILEQAHLNIARSYYELKEFVKAIEYYSKIPRDSDNWLTAIFEASWAFFLMERPNNTLGNIHTIKSPFFENRFFPEAYILEAITYLKMCRFDKVKEILKSFNLQYGPTLKESRQFLAALSKDSKLLFRLAYDARVDALSDFKSQKTILDSLSRTDAYKQAMHLVQNADSEIKKMEAQSPGLVADLGADLKKFLAGKKSKIIDQTSTDLKGQYDYYHGYLFDLQEQTKLISAEMLLGKIDSLKEELSIGRTSKKQVFIGGMQALRIGQDLEYWPFEGEYWEDELGGYVYNVESLCSSRSKAQ